MYRYRHSQWFMAPDGAGAGTPAGIEAPPAQEQGTVEGGEGKQALTLDDVLKDKGLQGEFDRRISKALETAKGKWETDANQRIQAARTEAERNPGAGTEAKQVELPTAGTDMLQKAHYMLQNAALTLAATLAGFADPTDALVLADRVVLTVDDDGVVTGAQEAIDALAKAKPHLLKVRSSPPAGGAAGTGGNGNKPATSIGKAAAERARARHQSAAKAAEKWTNN